MLQRTPFPVASVAGSTLTRMPARSMPGMGSWKTTCPWNETGNSTAHKCAVKDTSIWRYFKGIKPVDSVLCTYREK
jgi:hypothetical protein